MPAGAVSWLKLDIMCFSFSVPVLLGLPWGTASPAHPRHFPSVLRSLVARFVSREEALLHSDCTLDLVFAR